MKNDDRLAEFLSALGLDEEPMGVIWTDEEPKDCVSPKAQKPISREAEEKGYIDWQSVMENYACVLGIIWRARKKNTAACFDEERFGCLGGTFYLGFMRPYLHMHPPFISTGIPGIIEGELYAASPEAATAFFDAMDPPAAQARYCVVKPITQFKEGEVPVTVVFFARPEAMSGLAVLTTFITEDIDAVRSPFGPGCSGVVTWPAKYLKDNKEYAVLSGFDPSCRKFLKTDEMTFAVPLSLYEKMLNRWEESFLTTETWKNQKKKIERSRRVWGEE